MGNKQGTTSFVGLRGLRRADTPARNWSFHVVSRRKNGFQAKLNVNNSPPDDVDGSLLMHEGTCSAQSSSCPLAPAAKDVHGEESGDTNHHRIVTLSSVQDTVFYNFISESKQNLHSPPQPDKLKDRFQEFSESSDHISSNINACPLPAASSGPSWQLTSSSEPSWQLTSSSGPSWQLTSSSEPSRALISSSRPSRDLSSCSGPTRKLTSSRPSRELTSSTPSRELTSYSGPSRELTSSYVPSRELTSNSGPSRELTSSYVPSRELTSSYVPSRDLISSSRPSRDLSSSSGPSRKLTSSRPSRELIRSSGPSRELTSNSGPLRELTSNSGPSRELTSNSVPSRELTSSSGPSRELTSSYVPSRELTSSYVPSRELTSSSGPSRKLTSSSGPSRELTSSSGPSRELTSSSGPSRELTSSSGPSRELTSSSGPSGFGPLRKLIRSSGPSRELTSSSALSRDLASSLFGDPWIKRSEKQENLQTETKVFISKKTGYKSHSSSEEANQDRMEKKYTLSQSQRLKSGYTLSRVRPKKRRRSDSFKFSHKSDNIMNMDTKGKVFNLRTKLNVPRETESNQRPRTKMNAQRETESNLKHRTKMNAQRETESNLKHRTIMNALTKTESDQKQFTRKWSDKKLHIQNYEGEKISSISCPRTQSEDGVLPSEIPAVRVTEMSQSLQYLSLDLQVTPSLSSDLKVTQSLSSDLKVTQSLSSDLKVTQSLSSDLKVTQSLSSDLKVTQSLSSDLKLTPSLSSDLNVTPSLSSDLKVTPSLSSQVSARSREAPPSLIPVRTGRRKLFLGSLQRKQSGILETAKNQTLKDNSTHKMSSILSTADKMSSILSTADKMSSISSVADKMSSMSNTASSLQVLAVPAVAYSGITILEPPSLEQSTDSQDPMTEIYHRESHLNEKTAPAINEETYFGTATGRTRFSDHHNVLHAGKDNTVSGVCDCLEADQNGRYRRKLDHKMTQINLTEEAADTGSVTFEDLQSAVATLQPRAQMATMSADSGRKQQQEPYTSFNLAQDVRDYQTDFGNDSSLTHIWAGRSTDSVKTMINNLQQTGEVSDDFKQTGEISNNFQQTGEVNNNFQQTGEVSNNFQHIREVSNNFQQTREISNNFQHTGEVRKSCQQPQELNGKVKESEKRTHQILLSARHDFLGYTSSNIQPLHGERPAVVSDNIQPLHGERPAVVSDNIQPLHGERPAVVSDNIPDFATTTDSAYSTGKSLTSNEQTKTRSKICPALDTTPPWSYYWSDCDSCSRDISGTFCELKDVSAIMVSNNALDIMDRETEARSRRNFMESISASRKNMQKTVPKHVTGGTGSRITDRSFEKKDAAIVHFSTVVHTASGTSSPKECDMFIENNRDSFGKLRENFDVSSVEFVGETFDVDRPEFVGETFDVDRPEFVGETFDVDRAEFVGETFDVDRAEFVGETFDVDRAEFVGETFDVDRAEFVGETFDVDRAEFVGETFDVDRAEFVGETFDVDRAKFVSETFDVNCPEFLSGTFDIKCPEFLNDTFDINYPEFLNDNFISKICPQFVEDTFDICWSEFAEGTTDINCREFVEDIVDVNYPDFMKDTFDINHPDFVEDTFDINHPDFVEDTFDINHPDLAEDTFDINHPDFVEDAFDINHPDFTEDTFDINHPDFTKDTFEINHPGFVEDTFNINHPDFVEDTFDINHPGFVEDTFDINHPDFVEDTFDINHPDFVEDTFDINHPDFVEDTFDINHPDFVEDAFDINRPDLVEYTFDINHPEFVEDTFDINHPDFVEDTFDINHPDFVEDSFDINHPDFVEDSFLTDCLVFLDKPEEIGAETDAERCGGRVHDVSCFGVNPGGRADRSVLETVLRNDEKPHVVWSRDAQVCNRDRTGTVFYDLNDPNRDTNLLHAGRDDRDIWCHEKCKTFVLCADTEEKESRCQMYQHVTGHLSREAVDNSCRKPGVVTAILCQRASRSELCVQQKKLFLKLTDTFPGPNVRDTLTQKDRSAPHGKGKSTDEAISEASIETLSNASSEAVSRISSETLTVASSEALSEISTEVVKTSIEINAVASCEALCKAISETIDIASSEAESKAISETIDIASSEALSKAISETIDIASSEAESNDSKETISSSDSLSKAISETIDIASSEAESNGSKETISISSSDSQSKASNEAISKADNEYKSEANNEAVCKTTPVLRQRVAVKERKLRQQKHQLNHRGRTEGRDLQEYVFSSLKPSASAENKIICEARNIINRCSCDHTEDTQRHTETLKDRPCDLSTDSCYRKAYSESKTPDPPYNDHEKHSSGIITTFPAPIRLPASSTGMLNDGEDARTDTSYMGMHKSRNCATHATGSDKTVQTRTAPLRPPRPELAAVITAGKYTFTDAGEIVEGVGSVGGYCRCRHSGGAGVLRVGDVLTQVSRDRALAVPRGNTVHIASLASSTCHVCLSRSLGDTGLQNASVASALVHGGCGEALTCLKKNVSLCPSIVSDQVRAFDVSELSESGDQDYQSFASCSVDCLTFPEHVSQCNNKSGHASQCNNKSGHVSECDSNHVSRGDDKQMPGCDDEHMSRCDDKHVSGCDDEHMSRCDDKHVSGCDDKHVSGCDDTSDTSSRHSRRVINPTYSADSLVRNVSSVPGLRPAVNTLYTDRLSVPGHTSRSLTKYSGSTKHGGVDRHQKSVSSSKLVLLATDLDSSDSFIRDLSRRRAAASQYRDRSFSADSLLDIADSYRSDLEDNLSLGRSPSLCSLGSGLTSFTGRTSSLDGAMSDTAAGCLNQTFSDFVFQESVERCTGQLTTSTRRGMLNSSSECIDPFGGVDNGGDEVCDVKVKPRANSVTSAQPESKARGRIAMGVASVHIRRSQAGSGKIKPVQDVYALVMKPPKYGRSDPHSSLVSSASSPPLSSCWPGQMLSTTRSLQSVGPDRNMDIAGRKDQRGACSTAHSERAMPYPQRPQPAVRTDISSNSTSILNSSADSHDNIECRRSASFDILGTRCCGQHFNVPRQRHSFDSGQNYSSYSVNFALSRFDRDLPGRFFLAPWDRVTTASSCRLENAASSKENVLYQPSTSPVYQTFQSLHAPMSRASISLAPLPEENLDRHTSHDALTSSTSTSPALHHRYHVIPDYKDPPFSSCCKTRNSFYPVYYAKRRSSSVHSVLDRDLGLTGADEHGAPYRSQADVRYNSVPGSGVGRAREHTTECGFQDVLSPGSLAVMSPSSLAVMSPSSLAVMSPSSQAVMSQSADLIHCLGSSSSAHPKDSLDWSWRYSVTSLTAREACPRGTEKDLWMERASLDVCPACHRPFDSGKRRKLIDSCGHERCFTCVFKSGACPRCHVQVQRSRDGPRLKMNSGFTAHRPKLKKDNSRSEIPELPPRERVLSPPQGTQVAPPIPAKPKCFQPATSLTFAHQQGLGYQSHSSSHYKTNSGLNLQKAISRPAVSTEDFDPGSDSPPPPPPDVAQNDLMMRLGLLLGNRISPSGITGVGIMLSGVQQEEVALNSVSSLSGSEHTPERSVSDTSPMSTLTVSSGGDLDLSARGHHTQSTTLSPTGSKRVNNENKNYLKPANSVSTNVTDHRPRSISTSVPGAVEELSMFGGERNSPARRSAKATVSDERTNVTPARSQHLQLKPLVFEVPHPQGKPAFVARAWLFNELKTVLCGETDGSSGTNGVVIVGGLGTGKTAIVEHLVDHSCFAAGSLRSAPVESPSHHQQNSSTCNTKCTDQAVLNGLGSQVIAYHICQADNSTTCMVPDMVSSMAAQLARVPQLVAYQDLLLQEPQLQNLLSIHECIQNPSLSFMRGILEPLQTLKNSGKILCDSCIILIDSLNEAEFHRPDYGDTVASFLCHHVSRFPPWLKLVVTVQTALEDITSSLPFHRIYLDVHRDQSNHVYRDITDYVNHRISISQHVRTNISINGRLDKELQIKFVSHVHTLSKGSFLYAKLVLDLIERGHLVPKSSNYTLLPVNLSEVFLLQFNLRFSSVVAFERVSTILSICLASLKPLTLVDIFLTVNSGYMQQYLSWEDFCQRMDMLAGFLYCRQDNTYVFFHPAFRDWLIHREETDSQKYICDLRNGHALIAFRLSRVSAPLPPDKTIELGHHILKAHIYKTVSRQLGYSSRDMQAYWMCQSSHSLDAALVSHRNIFSPNVKVSRLILLSGSNPNSRTRYLSNAPLLCVAAREGFTDMVSLLMEFGADPNAASDTGMTPLCHAASAGHKEIITMLCSKNARLSAQDSQGQCAVIHAVIHGQLESLVYLLELNWPVTPKGQTKDDVINQCFVVSAATGNKQILEYLHQMYMGSELNKVDSLLEETALTTACLHGRNEIVQYLLSSGADITVRNSKTFTPLLCAAVSGRWEICDALVAGGADLETSDKHGRTPLMVAAGEGHVGVLNLLLDKGANKMSTDKEGLTALSWACLQGHILAVESLTQRGSDVNHADNTGRTPLHLATFFRDANIVQYLVDHEAQIEHTDLSGMRALDCAIAGRNTAIIVCFLRKGAKLGPDTWAMAAGKTDVLLLLLNKLMEDGHLLYKKTRIKEASQRFQYALKKIPKENSPEEARIFQELRLNFLLNVSRCKRRMNDLQSAIDWATKALEIRPECFEAFYARARARRDDRQYAAAEQDLMEALRLAPKNRELQRLLTRVKGECREQMARFERGGGAAGVETDVTRLSEDGDDSLQLGQYVTDGVAL